MKIGETIKSFLGVDQPKNRSVNRYKNKPLDESKRAFLKFGVGAAATAVVGSAGYKGLSSLIKHFEPKPASDQPAVEDDLSQETEDQKEMAEHDSKSLDQIINLQVKGKIDLNPQKMKELEHYWLNQYSVGKLHKSLEEAYRNMGEWRPYLEAEFKKEFDHNFLKKYGQANYDKALALIYLAIPESHWNVTAVSRTKAAGPYQFMKSTAQSEKINLRIGHGVDERKDPIRSSRACAKILKELFEASHDWDLALSGYNGGFIWSYLKLTKQQNQKPSYPQFVEFLEHKINEAKFKIETDQKLAQPQKEQAFRKATGGFSENLNYPAKFNAVIALINEGVVSEQQPALHFKEQRIANPVKTHLVHRHETISSLARKFGLTEQQLMATNNLSAKKPLKVGQVLHIQTKLSLASWGQAKGLPLKRLAHLNPHLDLEAPIHHNELVRV